MDEFRNNNTFENDNYSIPPENKEEIRIDPVIAEIFREQNESPVANTNTSYNGYASEPIYTAPAPEETYATPTPVQEVRSAASERVSGQSYERTMTGNLYIQQNPYQDSYYRSSQSNYYQNPYNSWQPPQPTYRSSYEPAKQPTNSGSVGKKILIIVLAVVIFSAAMALGISIGRTKKPLSTATVSGNTPTEENRPTSDNATLTIEPTQGQLGNDTVSPGIAVAKKARGSVVGIVVYDANGNLFGEGSGVVMGLNDAKTLTYIITCAHVVSDSGVKSCGIMLSDGTIYSAKIVGYDERTDIAVLSIEQTGLEAATFGDSTKLQVGETVYAIGNPGGSEFYGSMTSGIVSALDRSISSTYTMTVIQHNAAISPGNSGGALVNAEGQVIGINSSKISATDYEGIGFAVPISVAQPVVESLIKFGYVPNRPKLGISYASVSNYWRYSAIVQSKGLPKGSVIIASIADDSSFNGTSVAVGDMITSVNGRALDKSEILLDVIEKSKVGDQITLGICHIERSGSVGGSYNLKQFEVTVTLVEDRGSSSRSAMEPENQNFYDDSYGDYEAYGSFEEFFKQFFGSLY